jgi:hypothetical protein
VSNATPPGWYPDPWNHSAQRFWDGSQWTDHVAAAGGPSDRPKLPENAPIYGPWIWILALIPLLSGLSILFVHFDASAYGEYMRQLQNYDGTGPMPTMMMNPLTMFGPGYLLSLALSPLYYAATVALAYFDWRRLQRIGVERPFHWAWAFLASLVYIIGRSVIVRRVAAPRGRAPMWLGIAVYAAVVISSIIWSIVLVAQIMSQITNNLPTS